MTPDGLGRGFGEMRQPFMAAPGSDHLETRCPRPVDQIANQRRLIAVGEAVDHPGRLCLACEQGAAQGIGLDRDVDHVLAVGESCQTMLHRGGRIAGALHDNVDSGMRDQFLPVIAEMGVALRQRIVKRGSGKLLRFPADALQIGPREGGRKIGDPDQMHARDPGHLSEIHGAEFSGADQSDAQRISRRLALLQLAIEIHDFSIRKFHNYMRRLRCCRMRVAAIARYARQPCFLYG